MIYALRLLLILFVLTALVHIFAVVGTPTFAEQKVWQRIVDFTPPRKLTTISDFQETTRMFGQADPAMVHAVCHFDLSNGPVTVESDGPTSFWNVAIFNNEGETVYNLHNGVTESGHLNLQIRNKNTPDVVEQTEPVEPEPIPDTVEDKDTPSPKLRPNLSLEAPEDQTAETEIEDGNIVTANLDDDQLFLVFKIFRESRHHTQLISETLESAECK